MNTMKRLFLRLLLLGSTINAENFWIGVGKSDITDGAEGIGLQGWADSNQKTNDSPYQRIYARAYFMEDEEGALAAMVCTDNWAATDRVKREVLNRVGDSMEIGNHNFMLMASHAHSAPGGYSDYKLYENQVKGFDEHNFECIVAGIVAAMEQAKESMQPGNIYFNVQDITSVAGGQVTDVGGQRSLPAYNRNTDIDDFEAAVDHRMWLLKFTQGEEGNENTVGMINWYAIHPTSLGQYYKRTAGDNKGFASIRFEEENEGVIAAFANSHAGDVSGNMAIPEGELATDDEGYQKRMERFGNAQYAAAQKIFDTAVEKLDGTIDFRFQRVNMASYDTTAGRTASAGLGYSFAAGSREDGFPDPDLGVPEGETAPSAYADPRFIAARTVLSGIFGQPLFTNEAYDEAHLPKPVVLAAGLSDPPIVPHALPIQILKLGSIAISAVPGELTTMAGRRLMDAVQDAFNGQITPVIAGYANDYSQYITTFEEYQAQEYEGASTLFGPHTLSAYLDIFQTLARSIEENSAIDAPDVPRTPTSTPDFKRITFRSFCEGKVKFKIFDYGDTLMLVPRLGAPTKMCGKGDLVYENAGIFGDIKVEIGGSNIIGPIKKGDLVILNEDCETGSISTSYEPWWQAFPLGSNFDSSATCGAENGETCGPAKPCEDSLACLVGTQKCTDSQLGSLCTLPGDCDSSACIGGNCVNKAANGEACGPGIPCASALNCLAIKQKCTDKQLDSLCTIGLDCDSGACSDGKCVVKAKNGESCGPAVPCEGTMGCLAFTQKCTDGHLGSLCTLGENCNTGACLGGMCVEKGANGDTCGPIRPCESHMACLAVKQKCTDHNIDSLCTLNLDCNSASFCSGGRCVAGATNGQSCGPSKLCADGLACLAFAQKCTDGEVGSQCNVNGDCDHGRCEGNFPGPYYCHAPLGRNSGCNENSDCSSNSCRCKSCFLCTCGKVCS